MALASTPVPVLPLRNAVLFPRSVAPIRVGRRRSVRLVESVDTEGDTLVAVVAQKDPAVLEPAFDDLYEYGTLARIVKVIRAGTEQYSVVLSGVARCRLLRPVELEPWMLAQVEQLEDTRAQSAEARALSDRLRAATRTVLARTPNLPKETAGLLDSANTAGELANLIASNLASEHADVATRQKILETVDAVDRARLVLGIVERQLEVLEVKSEISSSVREELSQQQRNQVLRQQMQRIREELGEEADDELEELRRRLDGAGLPEEAQKAAKKQLGRMSMMQPQSGEYQVARNYVEWIADLPWSARSGEQMDVRRVRQCLDEDHFGLDHVKKRIVEFAAVRQLRRDQRGPILLFVGPPGVGKTSLGRSIARATGRAYDRIALGGVRDEAEIRGHRRTYVGAQPGRILQALKRVKVKNPVFVLDEVDKLGADLRGDPAAALLEVLDPAQNDSFADHYLDLPFDLSEVIFLATANQRSGIPPALEDRMELIEVPGYTRHEKLQIAAAFLVPRQLEQHAIAPGHLTFSDDALTTIIDSYTREAGVRELERKIAAVCRDATVRLADGAPDALGLVDRERVERVLGVERYLLEQVERTPRPGVALGLSSSATGGELLLVESTRMPGSGGIRVTGSLRTVMAESAAAAVSYVRSRASRFQIDDEWLRKSDLHVHVPRGGAVQDAAGAGVTIFLSVLSLALGLPLRTDVAVTGEVTLRGQVLPIGAVKAKLLAAHRAGIREVVLPARNEPDLSDVPAEIRQELRVRFIRRVDEVIEHAFVQDPVPVES